MPQQTADTPTETYKARIAKLQEAMKRSPELLTRAATNLLRVYLRSVLK